MVKGVCSWSASPIIEPPLHDWQKKTSLYWYEMYQLHYSIIKSGPFHRKMTVVMFFIFPEVCSLSKEKVLKRFYDLRAEISWCQELEDPKCVADVQF